MTPWTVARQAPLGLPWDYPSKNTGAGCHFLLRGIFSTQGLNPCLLCLLHCRQILYLLSHWGSLSYTSIYKATCILKPLKNTDAEDFPGGPVVKNPPANAGDMGSVAGSGRSPGIGNGNLLQYSCLENPIDREAWWATVHRVAKSWTQLSD